MWENFGEFDSAEEINRAAAAQLSEEDTDAILLIAKENGIDEEEAQDYIEGAVPALCTPMMAALGKIKVEELDLKPYEIMEDWISYIEMSCMEEPDMAIAVRKKGKSLRGCIAKILLWSAQNAKPVDKDIIKAAGAHPRTTLCGFHTHSLSGTSAYNGAIPCTAA